jgi:GDP-L-fucose synthase
MATKLEQAVRESKIFVAGHSGMVGSALVRALEAAGADDLLRADADTLDLTDQTATDRLFERERPDWVFLAAARVGGIQANNSFPADFIQINLGIELNVIHSAWTHGVKRLLFLGSSCIYPKLAEQPMTESALLTGLLEPTNEPYAIAKIAGIKLCESYRRQHGCDFRSVMPTNLYGPRDNFDLQSSHVIPALIAKFHRGKVEGASEVVVWGTGKPRREFLHVDDLAQACLHVMSLDEAVYWGQVDPRCSHINIGVGQDVSIAELASLVAEVIGYEGRIVYDTEKPDGTPRKLLDVTLLANLGWRASIPLREGLEQAYRWYRDHVASAND